VGAINAGRALIGTCFDEEAFAAVPVVAGCPAKLKEQGVITDSEFVQMKQDLIRRN
jgi:hypothetical protein